MAHPPRTKLSPTRALVVVRADCQIQFADGEAKNWLKRFFGEPARPGCLPPEVCYWLEGDFGAARAKSLIASQGDAQLFVSRQRPHPLGSVCLLLEIETVWTEPTRKHRALTRRESEVLHWLGRGKTNRDIGEILGVAPATVGKHLEHIYPKLGVENRTAAAHFAQQIG
jgi:DNA-binding CsgD family transcriptional regulator